jgi:hypothetical protein
LSQRLGVLTTLSIKAKLLLASALVSRLFLLNGLLAWRATTGDSP